MESSKRNAYEPKCYPKAGKSIISVVDKGSIAEELEIEPGDSLISINGQKVVDLIDYMYLIDDDFVEVEIEKPDGETWILEIEKEFGENLGIEFDNPIIDEAKSCSNRCVFCFIDQLPSGMRDTLYFKDDDSRLSFLQGNFVTLTNMSDDDIDRMIRYHISPVNVSIHATQPNIRKMMLGNVRAGNIMERLKKLTDAGIEVNGQIVLCKGINDGERLIETLNELLNMDNPIQSVAIVPFGATKYREKLYNIEMYNGKEAGEIIDEIHKFQKNALENHLTAFAFLSDEFYLLAGREFPDAEAYEGFIQLENGVGILKKFEDELDRYMMEGSYKGQALTKRGAIISGTSGYKFMKGIAKKINNYFGVECIEVFSVTNDFFGDTINVTGLLTGGDIISQCSHLKGNVDVVFLPESAFRDGEDIMLDDMRIDELSKKLGIKVVKSKVGGDIIIKELSSHLS